MLQRTLPTLLAAALWTTALSPALAQTKTAKSKPASSQPAAVSSGFESEVVGTVNGKPYMTFGQLINKLQKDNPTAFAAAVGQALGQKAITAFFGAHPQNQMTVTRAEIMQALHAHPPQPLSAMLSQELSQEAIRQTAAKLNALPTDAQLDEFTTYAIKQARKRMGAQFPATMTNDQFIAAVSPGLSRAKLKESLRSNVTMFNLAKLDIEKKINHPIGEGDFVQARHILIKADPVTPTATDDVKKADADAQAKITKIFDDIKAGKVTFEQAVKDDSEDPGSKENGGSLGTFMPDGTMVKAFQDVAFSTKPGEVSKPFRSEFGWHILQVTKTGKEMTPEERQSSLYDEEQKQSRLTFQSIVSQANIVNKLAPTPTLPIGPGGPPPGAGGPPR